MRIAPAILSVVMALAVPLYASGQSLPPASTQAPAPEAASGKVPGSSRAQPLWQGANGHALSVVADGQHAAAAAPASGAAVLESRTSKADTGLQLNVSPSVYARAGVSQREWLGSAPCQPAQPGAHNSVCVDNEPLISTQGGEVGAGYANSAVKLDLSVGQSRTGSAAAENAAAANLPRVLPSNGGASVAEPLLFPDSTTTSVNARSQVRVLPGTKLDLGASQGRVHFLPGTGAAIANDLNQTTLSLGIEHGPVSGTIVGRMLQPALPGAAEGTQRWAGIDLGVSVRLPWQGELSFGAQNVWSSGKQPLLNPQDISPEQARVPYVQYHQDL